MSNWNALIREHLATLNLAPPREAEIAEELTQHAEERYRDLQLSGASEAEARRITLDELTGGEMLTIRIAIGRAKGRSGAGVFGSESKDHRLAGFIQDLRYGIHGRSAPSRARFPCTAERLARRDRGTAVIPRNGHADP
jgi:hypothetical protein